MSPDIRINKKSCHNGLITAYLGQRDYIDHITYTQPIDGVVSIDPTFPHDKKVYVNLVCAFRYGREDLDVLGLSFRKDFCNTTIQVYPPINKEDQIPKTILQEKLLTKLGKHAYPFFIEIPKDSPCSVTLQPSPTDSRKPCGVDYELKVYSEDKKDEQFQKTSTIRLIIRKVQYAPERKGPQPFTEVRKNFRSSDKSLSLELSLDKELYYHGETISVNVHITNNSSKTVKKIKISVRQIADICLFSRAQYKCTVASLEADDQITPSSTLCKVYHFCPLASENKDKFGLALAGKMKHKDTNLASSTIVNDGINKENLPIVVQYKVKVKLVLGTLASDLSAQLPFSLMHPKPAGEALSFTSDNERHKSSTSSSTGDILSSNQSAISCQTNNEAVNDEIVFEDFARVRLQSGGTETSNQET